MVECGDNIGIVEATSNFSGVICYGSPILKHLTRSCGSKLENNLIFYQEERM